MIFWIVVAAISLAVALVLSWPLLRRSGTTEASAEYDLAVYRDQLDEIDREEARGEIDAEAAEAARAEVARRMLAAADRGDERRSKTGERAPFVVFVCLALGLPAAAIGLYLVLGSPGLPDMPLAERRSAERGEQFDIAMLAERLRRRLEAGEGDIRGWTLLARTYLTLGRYDRAVDAYQRALGLDSGDPALHSAYGEALVFAAGGTVTPQSRAAFEAALAIEPREPRARFYLALAAYQAGETRRALDLWVALIKESQPDAPWLPAVREKAAEAAKSLGLDLATLVPPPPAKPAARSETVPPGPSPEDRAAAETMSPEDRRAMIEGMVARLAARLEDDPDDLQGWIRLGRSYTVLGRAADAREAMRRAAELAPENADILVLYARTIRAAAGGRASPESVAVMRRVLEIAPDNVEALWFVAEAERKAGNTERARALLERALGRLPADSPERARVERRLDSLAE